jgi:preprotein translocase SecE subunit
MLAFFGVSLAGPNPPKGIRGSIFLGICVIFTAFFLVRGALAAIQRLTTKFEPSQIMALAFIGVCCYFFYRFVWSDRMTRWSIILESAGWFDAKSYKHAQGARVRRLTVFGLVLMFGSGIYTMWHNNVIADRDVVISLPFSNTSITIFTNPRLIVPLLLAAVTFWLAWRIVNYPVFADFLIATEAEINKVSWTPRARLIQDTIVVLSTVVIITLFLFVVDVFWGWILSREMVGILPSDAEQAKSLNNTRQVNMSEY